MNERYIRIVEVYFRANKAEKKLKELAEAIFVYDVSLAPYKHSIEPSYLRMLELAREVVKDE